MGSVDTEWSKVLSFFLFLLNFLKKLYWDRYLWPLHVSDAVLWRAWGLLFFAYNSGRSFDSPALYDPLSRLNHAWSLIYVGPYSARERFILWIRPTLPGFRSHGTCSLTIKTRSSHYRYLRKKKPNHKQ
jgi:hypothetical protein